MRKQPNPQPPRGAKKPPPPPAPPQKRIIREDIRLGDVMKLIKGFLIFGYIAITIVPAVFIMMSCRLADGDMETFFRIWMWWI